MAKGADKPESQWTPDERRVDFQENSDDEADERSSEEYLIDLELEFHERALLDEEEVSNDKEKTQVKVLMALADGELSVGKNHAQNGEWIDITMKKVNILLFMNGDSDWQTYLKYINIELEEQRLNLLSKYNKIFFELNKCRDDLLSLKQAKLEAVTFQIQNTELTKLNHALQEQLKEERKVHEEWLNISNRAPTDPESSKESRSEPQASLPLLKNL
uniref:Retrovirus-related Pol polyprotein from transposon TNT 1-94 n=1 Tax=Tanacetum cinerariifolium TaxID=118510 RepID=A0A699GIY9_TANCI|nr:retrovirus-related Pol polyprotein from transposon TNT 1-94 [Tanacetum cinerariifolium]